MFTYIFSNVCMYFRLYFYARVFAYILVHVCVCLYFRAYVCSHIFFFECVHVFSLIFFASVCLLIFLCMCMFA